MARAIKITTDTVPGSASVSATKEGCFNEGKEELLNEAIILSEFNQEPNIVHVLRYFEENNTAYFVMQYISGETLENKVKSRGKLSEYEADRILFPIMEALEKVHRKEIVHCDIGPDNIIITPEGTPYIIDFGAAHYIDSPISSMLSYDWPNKGGFAPLEQYGRKDIQKASTDVYAMAATYYYAVTGIVPCHSIDRSSYDTLVSPRQAGAKISEDTDRAIMKALALKSEDRYQSMKEFKSALDMGKIDLIFAKAVEILEKADRLKGKEACEKYYEAIVLFENCESIEEVENIIEYCQTRINEEKAAEQTAELNCQTANALTTEIYPSALPIGTILDGGHGNRDYELLGVLGEGSSGITYKAKERNRKGRVVAIKEYYPIYYRAERINNSVKFIANGVTKEGWLKHLSMLS